MQPERGWAGLGIVGGVTLGSSEVGWAIRS
jgi:hypothetical protein